MTRLDNVSIFVYLLNIIDRQQKRNGNSSAIYLPGHILNFVSKPVVREEPEITYRLPNPQHTLRGSLILGFNSYPFMKRSELNVKGSGYISS